MTNPNPYLTNYLDDAAPFMKGYSPPAYNFDSQAAVFDSGGSPSSEPWWGKVWDWANTDTGSSAIGAGVGGLLEGYKLDRLEDMNNSRLESDQDRWIEQFAIEREKLGLLHGQLDLERDKLKDKQVTRKKHNETINAGPQKQRSITRRT